MKTRKSLTGAIALALTILISTVVVAEEVKPDFQSPDEAYYAFTKGYPVYRKTVAVTGVIRSTKVNREYKYFWEGRQTLNARMRTKDGCQITLYLKEIPPTWKDHIKNLKYADSGVRRTYIGEIHVISSFYFGDTIMTIKNVEMYPTIESLRNTTFDTEKYKDDLTTGQPPFKDEAEAVEAFRDGKPFYGREITIHRKRGRLHTVGHRRLDFYYTETEPNINIQIMKGIPEKNVTILKQDKKGFGAYDITAKGVVVGAEGAKLYMERRGDVIIGRVGNVLPEKD